MSEGPEEQMRPTPAEPPPLPLEYGRVEPLSGARTVFAFIGAYAASFVLSVIGGVLTGAMAGRGACYFLGLFIFGGIWIALMLKVTRRTGNAGAFRGALAGFITALAMSILLAVICG